MDKKEETTKVAAIDEKKQEIPKVEQKKEEKPKESITEPVKEDKKNEIIKAQAMKEPDKPKVENDLNDGELDIHQAIYEKIKLDEILGIEFCEIEKAELVKSMKSVINMLHSFLSKISQVPSTVSNEESYDLHSKLNETQKSNDTLHTKCNEQELSLKVQQDKIIQLNITIKETNKKFERYKTQLRSEDEEKRKLYDTTIAVAKKKDMLLVRMQADLKSTNSQLTEAKFDLTSMSNKLASKVNSYDELLSNYQQIVGKLGYYETFCNEHSKTCKNYDAKITTLDHRVKRQNEKIRKLEATCRATEEQLFEKENSSVKKEVAYQRLYKETTAKINEQTELIKKYQKMLSVNGKSKAKGAFSEVDMDVSFSHHVVRKANLKTPGDKSKVILPPISKGKSGGQLVLGSHKSSSRTKAKFVAYKPKVFGENSRKSIDPSEENMLDNLQQVQESLNMEHNVNQDTILNETDNFDKSEALPNMISDSAKAEPESSKTEEKKLNESKKEETTKKSEKNKANAKTKETAKKEATPKKNNEKVNEEEKDDEKEKEKENSKNTEEPKVETEAISTPKKEESPKIEQQKNDEDNYEEDKDASQLNAEHEATENTKQQAKDTIAEDDQQTKEEPKLDENIEKEGEANENKDYEANDITKNVNEKDDYE